MQIVVKDEGPIRLVRMNRPEKKNALTSAMYADMASAIVEAKVNHTIRCVMLAGSPGAFCAGNDLADFQRAATGEGEIDDAVVRFLHALAHCDVPLVAAVDGLAVGVGTTMLLHCDYVVASDSARFMTPFVKLGLVPEAASSLLAPDLMGHRRAFSLLIMGRPLDAEAARECGLVNEISANVEDAAMKAAHEIVTLPRDAVAASRRLMRQPADIVQRIDEEILLYREFMTSPEAKAAFEKFFEKKKN